MKSILMIAVLATGVVAQGLTAPILENFDAQTAGTGACVTTLSGTLPAGWSNDASAPGGWQARSLGTSSFATGPSADFSGTGLYVYTETSGSCGTSGTPLILNLPSIDISGLSDPAVRFQAHLWGTAIGNLAVEALDPATSTWVNVGSLNGDRGDAWRQYEFSLIPVLTGATIDLRFVHTVATGVGVTSFEGDAALDEIEVADSIGVPPFLGDWQENSAEATVTLDGVLVGGPTAATAASTEACPVDTIAAVIDSTLVGLPFDIALDLPTGNAVAASAGGLTIPGGIVNVNLASPTLSFLNNLTFTTPFPGTLNLPIPAAFFGQNAAVQGVWVDPSAPGGFSLSQATEVNVLTSGISPALPTAGPTTDDGTLSLQFLCNASFPLFGQNFTEIGVNSNGRVTFGGVDGDFSATVAEALADQPFFGYWTDFNPTTGGNIDITTSAPGVVDVNWNGVAYFGEAGTASTFTLSIDTNTGILTIDGLSGLAVNPTTAVSTSDGYFLGLSAGNLGATDAGPSMFALGGAGLGAAPSDMLYETGQHMAGGPGLPAGVVSGTNSIQVIPLGGLGYTWLAF